MRIEIRSLMPSFYNVTLSTHALHTVFSVQLGLCLSVFLFPYHVSACVLSSGLCQQSDRRTHNIQHSSQDCLSLLCPQLSHWIFPHLSGFFQADFCANVCIWVTAGSGTCCLERASVGKSGSFWGCHTQTHTDTHTLLTLWVADRKGANWK